jgi:rubrerythrin
MPEKPSYLGLLNALAVGESRAHGYFSAWAEKTSDPAVKAVLTTVALREGEHGMMFAKRVDELGFTVREKPDPAADEAMAIATSDMSDLEKIEKLGLGQPLDLFDDFFSDHTIDARTGELLGRYIAEEHDTSRLVRSCCEQLQARHGDSGRSEVTDELTSLSDRVDGLCQAIEDLRQIVSDQFVAEPTPVTSVGRGTRAPVSRARNGAK